LRMRNQDQVRSDSCAESTDWHIKKQWVGELR